MTRDVPTQQVEVAEWREAHEALRGGGYAFFDFLTAVDQTDQANEPGFDVVSHVYDMSDGATRSILTKARVVLPELDTQAPAISSLTPVWRGAAWHERETFEMFGITFEGFDDHTGQGLRKLLLPDGFSGTPLRKSFILTARVSKPWPGAKDPGDREGGGPKRRKMTPPGVPDETWGPR